MKLNRRVKSRGNLGMAIPLLWASGNPSEASGKVQTKTEYQPFECCQGDLFLW
jgi:hypothetical protein